MVTALTMVSAVDQFDKTYSLVADIVIPVVDPLSMLTEIVDASLVVLKDDPLRLPRLQG